MAYLSNEEIHMTSVTRLGYFLKKMDNSRPLFLYFRLFYTVDSRIQY